MLRYGLQRSDVQRQWIFDRCREVQASPNGHLDLWAREHYKSTIVTYALTIQDILASHGDDPLEKWAGREPTFGIFSCTRPIAKGFLRQIKTEFEKNNLLKDWFPDVIWDTPRKEAPKWSEDDGIVLKRRSNPKESTVEAWGLVDGQPTSKHFDVLLYDDVVTLESVSTSDMMKKTTDRWEVSLNLGVDGGFKRYAGTRYADGDTYGAMLERGVVAPRIYPATVDGTAKGAPVLVAEETLDEKRRSMTAYNFACQMLLNPIADDSAYFQEDWLQEFDFTKGPEHGVILVNGEETTVSLELKELYAAIEEAKADIVGLHCRAFLEKEGFFPLFRHVKLADKWDIALMSNKGQSVTAGRKLMAEIDIPVLVLRDFDAAGFSIAGVLRHGTRRFRQPLHNVVDLGLRLEDVQECGLDSEPTHHSISYSKMRKNGATDKEIEFLHTQRVELNAFASDEFIAWI